jgi:mRNA-degrading endonuclease RelE of RelBE toxin-antitoxin system
MKFSCKGFVRAYLLRCWAQLPEVPMAAITFTKTFRSELACLPDSIRKNVLEKLKRIGDATGYTTHLKKLASLNHALRARVGDYRVIFSQRGRILKALCVRHRREVYRTLGKQICEQIEAVDDPCEMEPMNTTAVFPLQRETLLSWQIPSAFQSALVGCHSEEDVFLLADKGKIPEDLFFRIMDLIFPHDFERLEQGPAYDLPPLDNLEDSHQGDLLGYMLHLDDEQRRLAEMNVATQEAAQKANAPILVKGGPGSGKSTVALYRIRKILELHQGALFDKPKISFLTYTTALTKGNKDALTALLGKKASEVEVCTLDQMAHRIVTQKKNVSTILSETDKATLDLSTPRLPDSATNTSPKNFF